MCIQIDAMSVYAAIAASYIKAPADEGLFSHVQVTRELLDVGFLFCALCVDTRDMASDGLTERHFDRRVLHSIMNGDHKL